MNVIWRYIILIIIGFGGGVIIAGGVFAFIAIIGIVPRFAQKTNTTEYISVYEDFIMMGGILGTLSMVGHVTIPIGPIGTILFGGFSGIFVGCLAVSLAEVLDVIPVLTRRLNVKKGVAFFILAVAVGKMIGALVYWIVPGIVQYK